MPNPFVGNDDAAEYLEYFASSSMERNAVQRLHDEGCQRRREALQRAEMAAYPSRPQVVRTKEQIDAYLAKVQSLADRRQRKLIALEQQLYHQPVVHMDPQHMKGHLKHMYDDPLKKQRKRETRAAEERGDRPVSPQQIKERDINRAREAKWRPVATSPHHQDGKQTLVYDSPRRRAVSASGTQRKVLQPSEWKEKKEYFGRLSRPLRVYPKVQTKPKDAFNVYA